MSTVRLRSQAALVTTALTDSELPYVALEDVESATGRLRDGAELSDRQGDIAGMATAEPGDVLFGKLRPYLQKSHFVASRMHASSELLTIRPGPHVVPKWLAWLVGTQPFVDWAVATSEGTKMPRTSWERLSNFRFVLPTLDEQRRIADFLDAETARIDALIAKKRRLIGLLEERRVSVRDGSLAGAGGDSARLGRFVIGLGQGDSPVASSEPATDDTWGVLKLSCVRRGAFVPTENKALSARPRRPLVPDVGDILITRSNTPQLVGDACLVEEPAPRRMLCDLIYRVRLDERRLDPAYATEALLTTASRGFLSSVARGTSGSMVKLRGEDVRAVPLRVPTLEEQRRVVATIRRISRSVDHTTRALTRQIELLQERRQALITAAVTGQRPVLPVAV